MNKKKVIIGLIVIFIILFFMTVFININMINSTKKQILEIDELNDHYDAILVLGCRINDDVPSLMLARRLDMGINVYNKTHAKIVLTGSHYDDYDETNVMKNYILNEVDSSDILLDNEGFTTYDSIYRAKYVLKAKKVVIVTQRYHMYRALYLANKLDLEAVGVVANDIPQKFIMLKNEIREIFARDKNYFKGLIKPKSEYLNEMLPIN